MSGKEKPSTILEGSLARSSALILSSSKAAQADIKGGRLAHAAVAYRNMLIESSYVLELLGALCMTDTVKKRARDKKATKRKKACK